MCDRTVTSRRALWMFFKVSPYEWVFQYHSVIHFLNVSTSRKGKNNQKRHFLRIHNVVLFSKSLEKVPSLYVLEKKKTVARLALWWWWMLSFRVRREPVVFAAFLVPSPFAKINYQGLKRSVNYVDGRHGRFNCITLILLSVYVLTVSSFFSSLWVSFSWTKLNSKIACCVAHWIQRDNIELHLDLPKKSTTPNVHY